jgi:hypothetical protein
MFIFVYLQQIKRIRYVHGYCVWQHCGLQSRYVDKMFVTAAVHV